MANQRPIIVTNRTSLQMTFGTLKLSPGETPVQRGEYHRALVSTSMERFIKEGKLEGLTLAQLLAQDKGFTDEQTQPDPTPAKVEEPPAPEPEPEPEPEAEKADAAEPASPRWGMSRLKDYAAQHGIEIPEGMGSKKDLAAHINRELGVD